MSPVTGMSVLLILAAMGGGWLSRRLLLGLLRARHPGEFDELGNPSTRQLGSVLPRHQEVQLRFWKYLWGGQVFRLGDGHASALAVAALLCDAALAVGMALLLWSARE